MTSETANKQTEDGEKYRCGLCNLCYSSDKDLAEHKWSLIHHTEMEKKKSSANLSHNCSLCHVTVPSIKEYRSHIYGVDHKKAVERSRSGEPPLDKTTTSGVKKSKSGKKKKSKRPVGEGQYHHQSSHPIPGFTGVPWHYPPRTQNEDFDMYNEYPDFEVRGPPSSNSFRQGPGSFSNGEFHQDPPGESPEHEMFSMENENWNNVDWGGRAREWRHQQEQDLATEGNGWGRDCSAEGNPWDRSGYSQLPSGDLYFDFSRSYPGTKGAERARVGYSFREPPPWGPNNEAMLDLGPRKRQRDYEEEMSSSKSYKMADSSSGFRRSMPIPSSARSAEEFHARGNAFQHPRSLLSANVREGSHLPKSRLTPARSTESLNTPWSRGPPSKSSENLPLSKSKGLLGSADKLAPGTQKKSSALAIKQKYLGGKTGARASQQPKASKSTSLFSPRDLSDGSAETCTSTIVDEAARRVRNLRDQRMQANAQLREKARKQALTTGIDQQLEALASSRQSRISGALEKGSSTPSSLELGPARPPAAGRPKSSAASRQAGPASISSRSNQSQVRTPGEGSTLSDSEARLNLLVRSKNVQARNHQSDIERIRRCIENPDAPPARRHSKENAHADSADSSESSPQANALSLLSQQISRKPLRRDLLLKMVNAPRTSKDYRQLDMLKKQLCNQQTLPASRLSTLDDTEMLPDFTMGDLQIENMDATAVDCDELPSDLQQKISALLNGAGSGGGFGDGGEEEAQEGRATQPDSSNPAAQSPLPDLALQLADLDSSLPRPQSSLPRPQSSPSHAPEPSSTSGGRPGVCPLSPQPAQPPALPDTAGMVPDSVAGPSQSSSLQDRGVGTSPPHPSSVPGRLRPSLAGSSLQSASISAIPAVPSLPETSDLDPLSQLGLLSGSSSRTGGAGAPQPSSEAESSVASVLASSAAEGSVLERVLAFSEEEEKLQAKVERAEARMRSLLGALHQAVAHHNQLVQNQRTLQKKRLSLLRASDSQRSSQTSSSTALDSVLHRQPPRVPEYGRELESSQPWASTSAVRASRDLTIEDLNTVGERQQWREETLRPSSTSHLMAPPRPPSPAPPPAPSPPARRHFLPSEETGSEGGQWGGIRVKREPSSPRPDYSSPGLRAAVSDSLAIHTLPSVSTSLPLVSTSLPLVSTSLPASSAAVAPVTSSVLSDLPRRESGEQEVSSQVSRPQVIMSRPYSVLLDHRSGGFSSPMAMLDCTATYLGSITPYDDIRGQLHSHLSKLPQGFAVDEGEIKKEIQNMLHGGTPATSRQSSVIVDFARQNSVSGSALTDGEGQAGESHHERITPRGSDCSLGEKIRNMCRSREESALVCETDSDNTLVRDNSFEVEETNLRGLRECSVVLEKLPLGPNLQPLLNSRSGDTQKSEDVEEVRDEGENEQPGQSTGHPASPGQRRRLSRKERNRLSRRRKHELLQTTSEESSSNEAGGSPGSPRQRLQFQSRSPALDSEEDGVLDDGAPQPRPDAKPSLTTASLPATSPGRHGLELSNAEERKSLSSELVASTSSGNVDPDSSRKTLDESYVVMGTTPPGVESYTGPKARVACTLIHKDDLYVCYFGIQKPCRFQIERGTTKMLYNCGSLSMQCMAIAMQKGQEDRLFVGGDSRFLLAFKLNNPNRVLELVLGGRITCVHADSGFLYAGLDTGLLEVIDLKTNEKLSPFRCSESALSCIQSGQEGGSRLLCVGSQSGTIAVIDAQSGLLVRELTGHAKTPLAIQVAKHQVFSGGMDKQVMVHNLHNGSLEKAFVSSQGVIKAVVLDKDMLYIGGFDGLVRCCQNGELKQMYYGADKAGILTISIHKGKMYTGNSSGVVQSLPLKPNDRWTCKCSTCGYVFAYREHLKFHIFRDHILLSSRLMRCPWRDCQVWITMSEGAATSVAQKVDEHITKHLDECEPS